MPPVVLTRLHLKVLLTILYSFNIVVVKSFMKNLLMTKSRDCKSELVKGHASLNGIFQEC